MNFPLIFVYLTRSTTNQIDLQLIHEFFIQYKCLVKKKSLSNITHLECDNKGLRHVVNIPHYIILALKTSQL